MHVAPDITEEDISQAEQVLLPPAMKFDAERRAFIRRLDTLDLHAVPGSGKTTALLAKLLILERFLPFADGSAILVLSHTNAAVEEIRRKLGLFCPRLFRYPNYVGTIQGFVDQFLAIPYFIEKFKKQPIKVDNDLYIESANAFSNAFLPGFGAEEQNNAKHLLRNQECSSTFRFRHQGEAPVMLVTGINGAELKIEKPRGNTKPQNYRAWTEHEKKRVKDWLISFKAQIMRRGVLCFDDAYFLANVYLTVRPSVAEILRQRFRYVFVDEMQDMGSHQHDLLETIFFEGSAGGTGYQRIGDRNQAIHDNTSADSDCCWTERNASLAFANSCRLSPPIAKVVESFAIHRIPEFGIRGLGHQSIRPIILVYKDETISQLLPKFSFLIKEKVNPLPCDPVFRAVGWNTSWNEGSDKDRVGKKRLVDYWPQFKRNDSTQRLEQPNLLAFIRSAYQRRDSFRKIVEFLTNVILKILRLENVASPDTDSYFTRTAFWAYLRASHAEAYEQWRHYVYQWAVAVRRNLTNEATQEIKNAVPNLLALFGKTINSSAEFVNGTETADTEPAAVAERIVQTSDTNIINLGGFDIEISSVHAVKGQTHTATLYMETAFYTDGRGASAKSYESQRLAAQFLGHPLKGNEGKRVKQSAKMVYVGFSRPTHLLCVAVHESHFNQYLGEDIARDWDIIRINTPIDLTVPR